MPKEGREKSQESFEPVFSVLERIDSHPKVDKPIHLRSRLIKIKLRRSSIIGRRSIRAAISKLVLDVVFFSFHPSFATTRPSPLSVPCVCVGQGMEISWKFRILFERPPQFIENLPAKSVRKKCSPIDEFFFGPFFFPFRTGLSLHSLSFKVKVFAYSSKKIITFDYGDFFKEKLMNSFGVEMIRKIEE